MSEDSSAGAPDIATPDVEHVPLPTAPWQRRTRPRVRIAAAVITVAAITSVVYVVVRSGPPGPAYSSLPAPCAMVSPATVARYLPDPVPAPESVLTDSTYQAGSCKWASTAGGEDRTLVAQVFVYDSSSSVSAAQQAYNSTFSSFGCHCQGVTVSTQSVTGLGDQAAAFIIAVGPAAAIATAPNAGSPGLNLLVRSSNALIALDYDVTAPATGTSLASAAGTAQLTAMISMARGILAALAQPTTVASVPVSPEPRYTGSHDPCLLITTATLAMYAPGATVTPQASPGTSGAPQMSSCSWGSDRDLVMLTLSSFPDATSARQVFDIDAQANSRSIAGETVTGSVWMPDLGEEATAIFQTRSGGEHGVAMIVWSGNVEINVWYAGRGAVPPERATLLAGGIAMARDVLAALPRQPGSAG
ncbi:MAG TPA: hypothetical protein VIY52_11015 [Streptosporangiaceae bacterium]